MMLLCGKLGREQAGRLQVWGGWSWSQLRWLEEMSVHANKMSGWQRETSRLQSPPPCQPPDCSRHFQPAPCMPSHRGSGFPGWEWQCFHGITDGFPACSMPSPHCHPVAQCPNTLTSANCTHSQLSNSIPLCSSTPLPLAACSPQAICWTSSNQSLGGRQKDFPLC